VNRSMRKDDVIRGVPTTGLSYEEFKGARYFPELDGLRAISILLVITVHTTDPMWAPLHGDVGVTIFFVISGFIITTLLLREEDRRGYVRVGAFYLRRAFRILPVYYLILAAYILLVGVLKIQPGAKDLWQGLPYFATYQNDFAHSKSGFAITWSLAIEEKFYLLWPLLFLPAVSRVWRVRAACFFAVAVLPFALGSAAYTASSRPGWHYPAIYAPIIDGCLVALLMHSRRGYSALRPLAAPFVAPVLVLAAGAEQVLLEPPGSNIHVVFALLVAVVVPACVTGPHWFRRALRSRLMVYIGTRSYVVYLVHRLSKGVIDRFVGPGGEIWTQVLRLILVTALALAAAEVVRALVEQPMIRLGRRLTSREGSALAVTTTAPVTRPDHPLEALAEDGPPASAPDEAASRSPGAGEQTATEPRFPAFRSGT
jgi:peptidoglycan/LPS O-acetylase OafA/YrhL